MIDGKKVLGIIPARGGSKSIPKKNIALLNGKPLIYYTIKGALKSKYIDKLICSTEDKEIAKIAGFYGAEIPFMRPEEFATDKSLGVDVMRHAIKHFEDKNDFYDILVVLQPTSPLRIVEDIDESIKKLIENEADSVISVVKVIDKHPFRMNKIESGLLVDYEKEPIFGLNKQDLPEVFVRNGAVYAFKKQNIERYNSYKGQKNLPHIMPEERSINIDSELDLKFVEFLMKEQENN